MLRARRKRKAISLTPLVDVIFLLLLFFMLSSTFSKYAEVELTAAPSTTGVAETSPIFVQLFPDRVTFNGRDSTLEDLPITSEDGQRMLVALQAGVTAQRLTDLLVALRTYPGLSVTVLGSS